MTTEVINGLAVEIYGDGQPLLCIHGLGVMARVGIGSASRAIRGETMKFVARPTRSMLS
ncbi:TPA: hypothetical protein ACYLN4_005784 [Burkholderia lata]